MSSPLLAYPAAQSAAATAIPLSPAQLDRDLSLRDLTDAAMGRHAIQSIVDAAMSALADAWACEVRWCPGPRIVTIADNYDNLGYEPAAVTRDTRYTRYVDAHRMLRSHSTAMIPAALRQLAEGGVEDVLLVCPGMVYRRDAIGRLHTGTPHQLDLWRITTKTMDEGELDGMIRTLLHALVPELQEVIETRTHPYTLAGRQVDVVREGERVEVWECGIAHPSVLAQNGLNPSVGGLALGMGLDRLLMLVKGIPDIRALRASDARIAEQMGDLSPYRPISGMPAIKRDLSLVVEPGREREDLGDTVRDALGVDADAVEDVTILSETPCTELPPAALGRLGARPEQANLLIRVTLRHLERTLTDSEANEMRDRVYEALHEGATHQWASR